MNHRTSAVLATAALTASLLVPALPATSASAAPVSGSRACSTAKGKLRATHTWTPNGRETFHQVWTTPSAKVKGKSALPYTYTLWSVKNSANAPVKYMRGARVFSTRRGVVPTVTVTWRAKVPYTIDRYIYASCTTRA